VQHFASGAGPPDIDNPVEIHLVLEVQVKVKVGERAAPTIAAARWRFFIFRAGALEGKRHHRPRLMHMT